MYEQKKKPVKLRSFYRIVSWSLLMFYHLPIKSIVTNCDVHKRSSEKYNDIAASRNRQSCAHKNLNKEVIDFGGMSYSTHHKNKLINLSFAHFIVHT